MTLKHSFTSALADDGTAAAAGEVLPSHWNADHVLSSGDKRVLFNDVTAIGQDAGLTFDKAVQHGAIGPHSAVDSDFAWAGGAGWAGYNFSNTLTLADEVTVPTFDKAYGLNAFVAYNPTADSPDSETGAIWGEGVVADGNTKSIGYIYGGRFDGACYSAATVYEIIGAFVNGFASAGTINFLEGCNFAATAIGTAVVSEMYGVAGVVSISGGASVGKAYANWTSGVTGATLENWCYYADATNKWGVRGDGVMHVGSLSASQVVLTDGAKNLVSGGALGAGAFASDAAADGATKGIAAFTAADFNASLGVISLDYTNAQKASASVPGFLTAADWTTFNGKQAAGNYAVLGANTFTALQTITQAAANAGILASTGYSLTGSNTTSMATLAGTLNTSGAVNVVDLDLTTTNLSASSNLLRIRFNAIPTAFKALNIISGASTTIFNVDYNGGMFANGACNLANGGLVVDTSSAVKVFSSYTFGWSTDLMLSRSAAATLQQGAANAASPVAQTLQAQGSRAGTDNNIAGANYTIQSGQGTGSATGSSLIFKTPLAVGGGTGAQTQTTCLSLAEGSKVGLYAATPVVQATGYGTPTNAANQGSYDATTITLPNLAAHVARLCLDLKALGAIGA